MSTEEWTPKGAACASRRRSQANRRGSLAPLGGVATEADPVVAPRNFWIVLDGR